MSILLFIKATAWFWLLPAMAAVLIGLEEHYAKR